MCLAETGFFLIGLSWTMVFPEPSAGLAAQSHE